MSLGISSICRARSRLVHPAGLSQLPASSLSLRASIRPVPRTRHSELLLRYSSDTASRSETTRFSFSDGSFRLANGTFGEGGKESSSPEAPGTKSANDGGSIDDTQVASTTKPIKRTVNEINENGGNGVGEDMTSLTTGLVENTAPAELLSDVQNAIATKTLPTNNPTLRNAVYREIYRTIKPDDPLIEEKLASPFVPQTLSYSSALSRRMSLDHIHTAAKNLIAQDKLWAMHLPEQNFVLGGLRWNHIFRLLKAMTPKQSEGGELAAMRLVLPENVSFDFEHRRLEFVDSTTGRTSRLRASGDRANSTGVILRGPRKALGKVADELIQVSKEVKVFELGEVTTQDYVATQLWPAIDNSAKDETANPDDNAKTSLWVHTEFIKPTPEPGVEHMLIPVHWSVDRVSSFITNVIYARIPPTLDPTLHGHLIEQIGDGSLDRDAVKARLIMKVLTDATATPFITAHVLKMSLAFLVQRAGYIAAADRLLSFAEERGLPLDTEFFNILLEGYVTNLDYRHFYKLLRKMRTRFFQPNARTWLLFLRLVQGNSERQRIVASMYDLGLFKDPATRRGIARIFAQREAHLAFKSGGANIQQFTDTLTSTYGNDWRTQETLSCILKEYLLVVGKDLQLSQLELLIQKEPVDGRPLDIGFFNDILEHCLAIRGWNLAIWTLQQMDKRGIMPDEKSYDHLIRMSVWTKRQRTLGAVLFQAILDQGVTSQIRWILADLIQGRRAKSFWRTRQPLVFNRAMLLDISLRRKLSSHDPWHDMVQCILSECGDLVPDQPLAETVDHALRLDNFEHKYQQRLNKPLPFKLKHRDGTTPGRTILLQHSSAENPATLDSRTDSDESWIKLLSNSEMKQTPLSATERLRYFLSRGDDCPVPAISALLPDPILNHEEFKDIVVSSIEDTEQVRKRITQIQNVEKDEFWGYDAEDAPQHSTTEDGDSILATLEIESGNTEPSRIWDYFGFCEAWDVPCFVLEEASTTLTEKPTTKHDLPASSNEKETEFFTSQNHGNEPRIMNTAQFRELVGDGSNQTPDEKGQTGDAEGQPADAQAAP